MRKRSKFNMSHVNSLSCKMGYIVPIMLQEALPGDTFQGDNKVFCRVAPLVAPVMHKVWIDTFTVFVPNRIIWKSWEDFITGGPDGNSTAEPPTVSIKPTVGTLADYFGLPLTANSIQVSALPFRAYALAYNELFRDQDLDEELPISLEDGADTTTSTELQRCKWQKDYFTTARPNPQKGPQVTIPIQGVDGSTAFNVVPDGIMKYTLGSQLNNVAAGPVTGFLANDGGIGFAQSENSVQNPSLSDSYTNPLQWLNPNTVKNDPIIGDYRNRNVSRALTYESGLKLNLGASGSVGLDINSLRLGFALQRFQERRSLYGSRYEDLLHFWGLRTQDARLQLPELISVKHAQLQFSEVLQTSADETNTGVGQMFGHGIGAMRSGRWRYYCWEHGWIMTFVVIRPQAVYTQGIERMWTRSTRFDYWNPEYQHIGQQEVYLKELFADGTESDDTVFGYQNRYDEYRRGKNHVTGEFRTTLDYWNMARVFENAPALNSEFITCNPTDRIFQLSADLSDQLYMMVQNDLVAKRLMSRNGNPI